MEHLMRKCIDSVLRQTFRNTEVLLVDDGSTDNSPAICDEYIKVDGRVRVFHKPNGGLSDARNLGLAHAQGKYIIFADPDDWVDADGLDKLYEKAEIEDADMTICDLYREDCYVRHYVKQQPSSLDRETVLRELFLNIGGFTVNKLIKREIYQKYNITYPLGIYGCEDQYTMASILLHDVKIAYEPVAFYHYMYNSNSLTRYYDENTYEMDITILKMFERLLQGTPVLQYAYKCKSDAIFIRAFWIGGHYYNSSTFKQRFYGYRKRVFSMNEMFFIKCLMYFSCFGFFSVVNHILYKLFYIKNVLKKYPIFRSK